MLLTDILLLEAADIDANRLCCGQNSDTLLFSAFFDPAGRLISLLLQLLMNL